MVGLPGGRTTCRSELVNWVCWCWKSTRHRNLGQNQNHCKTANRNYCKMIPWNWLDLTILWMHLEKNTTILITSQKYKSLSLPMSSLPGRVSQLHLTDGQGGILTTPHAVAGTIWALANVSNCIKNLILIVNHCWLLVLGRNMCAH